MNMLKTYCGFVSIVGRPNVGKSTLANKLVGSKVSITSRKAHTTKCEILIINTKDIYQTIYIDTPGLNKPRSTNFKIIDQPTRKINLILFLVEKRWLPADEVILKQIKKYTIPVVVLINKTDQIKKKKHLLPYIKFIKEKSNFLGIIPISTKNGTNINIISTIVRQYLPESAHHFPKEWITDRSFEFRISEIIREKGMRLLGDELPYSIQIKIQEIKLDKEKNYSIYALIYVKCMKHKEIVIGRGGKKIKLINLTACKEMKKLFKLNFFLNLWVKHIR